MLEAHSLDNIKSKLSEELKPILVKRRVPKLLELTKQIDLMTPLSHSHNIEYTTVTIKTNRLSRLVGILFCHPKSPLAKSDVIEHLDYFHHRSGSSIDFFCIGYGADWSEDEFKDQDRVTRIDGTPWFFSSKAFDQVRREIEAESSWKYSGESELILLTAKSTDDKIFLDFTTAMVCNLEQMARDKAFSSVRAFFETIFSFSENLESSDPAFSLSDQFAVEKGRSALVEAVLSLLPPTLKDTYHGAKHYAIKDISQ